jgi:hypothetical protein
MSAVPPSPAMAIVTILLLGSAAFLIKAFSPDSTPEATAAAFSKATCNHGTLHEVKGIGDEITSIQPVAEATITFLPKALQTNLIANASQHP